MRATQILLVVTPVLLVAGCAAQQPADLAPSTVTLHVEPSSPPTGSALFPDTDGKQTTAPHDAEQPSASPEVGAEATRLATDAVTAFCRPVLDHQTWIDGLYPFLSQTAAVAYGTVNPARVPCTALTGGARVRDDDGIYTVRVIVPTDAGEYTVYVHRLDLPEPWLVESITPTANE